MKINNLHPDSMTLTNQSTKNYFQNLDGMRFLAFFAVFVHHAATNLGYYSPHKSWDYAKKNFLQNGDLGVSFFFVLSGFLITYLLLSEKERHGKINIKNFYIRRVLRIWPVYYLVVILCLFFFPILNNHIPGGFPITGDTSEISPILYLTFLGNFDFMIHGIHNFLIGPLWSVSVEEQFYLFWPLLIAFIPKRFLMPSFITVIAASIGYRYFIADGRGLEVRFHSLSSMSDLAIGAMIALLSTKERFIKLIKRIPKYIIALIYLIGISAMPLRLYIWMFGKNYTIAAAFTPIAIALFFAFIILEQNYSDKSFYKISRSKIMTSLGKYTYGMYCYHMLVFFCVLFIFQRTGINVVGMNGYLFTCVVLISLFATILASIFSYHWFEGWFLKLKARFTS
jgi:peptidoglycan/LPS O-acetylase OafA/YrhL